MRFELRDVIESAPEDREDQDQESETGDEQYEELPHARVPDLHVILDHVRGGDEAYHRDGQARKHRRHEEQVLAESVVVRRQHVLVHLDVPELEYGRELLGVGGEVLEVDRVVVVVRSAVVRLATTVRCDGMDAPAGGGGGVGGGVRGRGVVIAAAIVVGGALGVAAPGELPVRATHTLLVGVVVVGPTVVHVKVRRHYLYIFPRTYSDFNLVVRLNISTMIDETEFKRKQVIIFSVRNRDYRPYPLLSSPRELFRATMLY